MPSTSNVPPMTGALPMMMRPPQRPRAGRVDSDSVDVKVIGESAVPSAMSVADGRTTRAVAAPESVSGLLRTLTPGMMVSVTPGSTKAWPVSSTFDDQVASRSMLPSTWFVTSLKLSESHDQSLSHSESSKAPLNSAAAKKPSSGTASTFSYTGLPASGRGSKPGLSTSASPGINTSIGSPVMAVVRPSQPASRSNGVRSDAPNMTLLELNHR
mmetsp:Transcript_17292/g.52600  ORF Transcript_17292/g.52600 Transcript_17292/m.52600 type:complete len:213 (+) Transcript_17292:1171-1809(+)